MSEPVELMPTELLKDTWQVQDRVYEGDWWLTRYWESTEGSHRDAVIRALGLVGDFESVLEIGCNAGPNLRRIHRQWPRVELSGMDIHPGAIAYGRRAATAEGWAWAGYVGDLRELGLLGADVADVVLSCYSLAYLDPRDIDAALAAALACARKALVLCEPMVLAGEPEKYGHPGGGVPEYHHAYLDRLAMISDRYCCTRLSPITPPHQRLEYVLTVLK